MQLLQRLEQAESRLVFEGRVVLITGAGKDIGKAAVPGKPGRSELALDPNMGSFMP